MILYSFLQSLEYNVDESIESPNREMLISIRRSPNIEELVSRVYSTENRQSTNVHLDDLL